MKDTPFTLATVCVLLFLGVLITGNAARKHGTELKEHKAQIAVLQKRSEQLEGIVTQIALNHNTLQDQCLEMANILNRTIDRVGAQ